MGQALTIGMAKISARESSADTAVFERPICDVIITGEDASNKAMAILLTAGVGKKRGFLSRSHLLG